MIYALRYFLFLSSFILTSESIAKPFFAELWAKSAVILIEEDIISINSCEGVADKIEKIPNFVKFIKNGHAGHSNIDHSHLSDIHYHIKFDIKVTSAILREVLLIIEARSIFLTKVIAEYEKYLQSLEISDFFGKL